MSAVSHFPDFASGRRGFRPGSAAFWRGIGAVFTAAMPARARRRPPAARLAADRTISDTIEREIERSLFDQRRMFAPGSRVRYWL